MNSAAGGLTPAENISPAYRLAVKIKKSIIYQIAIGLAITMLIGRFAGKICGIKGRVQK